MLTKVDESLFLFQILRDALSPSSSTEASTSTVYDHTGTDEFTVVLQECETEIADEGFSVGIYSVCYHFLLSFETLVLLSPFSLQFFAVYHITLQRQILSFI